MRFDQKMHKSIFPIIRVLTVVSMAFLITCQGCAAQVKRRPPKGLELPPNFDQMSKKDQEFCRQNLESARPREMTHPVLKIQTCEPLDIKKLEVANLNALCHLKPTNYSSEWYYAFADSELEAAQAIVPRVSGKSKSEISALLGRVEFKGEVPEFVKHTPSENELWGYAVGGNKFVILLIFNGEHCVRCEVADRKLAFKCCQHFAESMSKNAVGKTYEQIQEMNGPAEHFHGVTNQESADIEHGNFLIIYCIGKSNSVSFKFKDNVCIESGTGLVAH